MESVIIITMAFVLLIPTTVFAQNPCSAPDGYCMDKYGMNNPESYSSCLANTIAECESQPKTTSICEDLVVGQYTLIEDYDLLYDLILNGLNEKNLDAGKIVVDNYKDTQQYELECNFLWKEFNQIRTESENWHNSCGDSDYPNSIQLQNMYNTMNGVCRFATLVPVEQSINESEIICGKGTVEKNGQCVPDTKSSKGGGCLIATATYGSELAPQVQQLRELRDNSLLQTESGSSFMGTFNDFYYSFSPIIADYERENPVFKEMVKVAITPMISSLSLLNYVDMDSESKVLGYGIALIMLNGMAYLGIPVSVIILVRKF